MEPTVEHTRARCHCNSEHQPVGLSILHQLHVTFHVVRLERLNLLPLQALLLLPFRSLLPFMELYHCSVVPQHPLLLGPLKLSQRRPAYESRPYISCAARDLILARMFVCTTFVIVTNPAVLLCRSKNSKRGMLNDMRRCSFQFENRRVTDKAQTNPFDLGRTSKAVYSCKETTSLLMLVQRLCKVLQFLLLAPCPLVPQLLLLPLCFSYSAQAFLQLHLTDVLQLGLRRSKEAVLQRGAARALVRTQSVNLFGKLRNEIRTLSIATRYFRSQEIPWRP